jgi:lysozyme
MAMKRIHKITGATALAIAIAVPVVTQFEGVSLHAYHDRLAHGIPTVCAGETEGVKMGDVYTVQQCADMLAAKLPRYADELMACVHVPISAKTEASFISFSYNIGTAGFCHSGTVRKLNKRDYVGACNAMMNWNISEGQVQRGLINRRTKERNLCMEGLL